MTSYAEIYRNKESIIDKFYEMVAEAEENRQKEYKAAVKIQSVVRMYNQKLNLKKMNEAALKIQRNWRMHFAKTAVMILRVEKAQYERTEFFNEMARKIQRTWRGYHARKHTFNYWKHKNYLVQQSLKNMEMKMRLDEYYAQTAEERENLQLQAEAKREEDIALHSHYLVSTTAIPSIYQPPSFTKDASSMPAIEHFIRSVNKSKIVIPSIGVR